MHVPAQKASGVIWEQASICRQSHSILQAVPQHQHETTAAWLKQPACRSNMHTGTLPCTVYNVGKHAMWCLILCCFEAVDLPCVHWATIYALMHGPAPNWMYRKALFMHSGMDHAYMLTRKLRTTYVATPIGVLHGKWSCAQIWLQTHACVARL